MEKKMGNRSRGLTLIEVLVAVLILAIFLLGLGSAVITGLNTSKYTRERMFLSIATRSVLDQISSYSLDSIQALNGSQFEIKVGSDKVVPGYVQMSTTRPFKGTSDLCLVTMTHYPGDGTSEVVVTRVFGNVVPKAGEAPRPPDLPPTADFKGEPRSGAPGLIVRFTDLSSGVVTQWNWIYGDGTSSGWGTNSSPTHQYNAPGEYTVQLQVKGPTGQDSALKTAYIKVGALDANFEGTPLYGSKPLNVALEDRSTGNVGSWSWEIRKGGTIVATSTVRNPTFTLTECGYYDVKLTVTDSNTGATDTEIKSNYIKVMPKLTVVSAYGTPTPTVGNHLYDPGEIVSCEITPTQQYEGEGTRHNYTNYTLSGGSTGSGTQTKVNVRMDDDTTIVWNWATEHRLRIRVDPANGSNTLTASPPGTSTKLSTWTDIWYAKGSTVTLTASGGSFSGWGGSLSGMDNPKNITMSAPTDAVATFGTANLTVASSVVGTGFTPPVGTTPYNAGTRITCEAPQYVYVSDSTRWKCTGWTLSPKPPDQAASGSGNSVTFTINTHTTLTWSWVAQYKVTASVTPSGGGSVTMNSTDGWYDTGAVAVITANAASGWEFDKWTGDASGTSPNVNISVNSPKTVIANFKLLSGYVQLTVDWVPTGGGIVQKQGGGDPNGAYPVGSTVVLVAQPASGYIIDYWVVNGSHVGDKQATYTLVLNTNTTARAVFATEYIIVNKTWSDPFDDTSKIDSAQSSNYVVASGSVGVQDPGGGGGYTETLDAKQESYNSWLNFNDGTAIAQTFKPTASGKLAKITVYLYNPSGTANMRIGVKAGNPDSTNPEYSSDPITISGYYYNTYDFQFSGTNQMDLVANTTYSLIVYKDSGDASIQVYYYGADVYTNGSAWTYSSSAWAQQSYDLYFVVYAERKNLAAQTFQSTASGKIDTVRVYISVPSNSTVTLRVKVKAGDPNSTNTEYLSDTQTITNYTGTRDFVFQPANQMAVTTGTIYSLIVYKESGGNCFVYYYGANYYTSGTLYLWGDSSWVQQASYDLYFYVYVSKTNLAAQTFIPSMSGTLNYIRLYISMSGGSADLRIGVKAGDPNSTNTEYFSDTLTVSSSNYYNFSFTGTNQINLTSGATYSLIVYKLSGAGNAGVWYYTSENYSNGVRWWYNYATSSWASTTGDLYFVVTISNTKVAAQTFIPNTGGTLDRIRIYTYLPSGGTVNMKIGVKVGDPNSNDTEYFSDSQDISSSGDKYFVFSGANRITLVSGTTYSLIVYKNSGAANVGVYYYQLDNYGGGCRWTYGGATWTAQTTYDLYFTVYIVRSNLCAQTFVPSVGGTLNYIRLNISMSGGSADLRIGVKAGDPNSTNTEYFSDTRTISSTGTYDFTFSGANQINLTSGATYSLIVYKLSGAGNAGVYYYQGNGYGTSGDTTRCYWDWGGTSWVARSTYDMYFTVTVTRSQIAAQTFVPSATGTLNRVYVYLYVSGGSAVVRAVIKAGDPNSGSTEYSSDAQTVSSSNYYWFTFSGSNRITLSSGAPYSLIIYKDSGTANVGVYYSYYDYYGSGSLYTWSGSSWTAQTSYDMYFYVYVMVTSTVTALDQQNPNYDGVARLGLWWYDPYYYGWNSYGIGTAYYLTVAQTFQPGVTGLLEYVRVYVRNYSSYAGTLTVRIRSGSYTGTEIASASVTINGGNYLYVNLYPKDGSGNRVNLTANTTYSMNFDFTQTGGIDYYSGNSYTRGQVYRYEGGSWYSYSSWDLEFYTYMTYQQTTERNVAAQGYYDTYVSTNVNVATQTAGNAYSYSNPDVATQVYGNDYVYSNVDVATQTAGSTYIYSTETGAYQQYTSTTVASLVNVASQTDTSAGYTLTSGISIVGQRVIPNVNGEVTKVVLKTRRTSATPVDLVVRVRIGDQSGTQIATATLPVPSGESDLTFTFSSTVYPMAKGNLYTITVEPTSGAKNCCSIALVNSNSYTPGNYIYYTGTWAEDANKDLYFKVYQNVPSVQAGPKSDTYDTYTIFYAGYSRGEVFKMVSAGAVMSAQFEAYADSVGNYPMWVAICGLSSGLPNEGDVKAQTYITVPLTTTAKVVNAAFKAVDLMQNQSYALVVRNVGSGTFYVNRRTSGTDIYTDGYYVYNNASSWTSISTYDMKFWTYTMGTAGPNPGTVVSIDVTDTKIFLWNRFTATHTIPSGAQIKYEIRAYNSAGVQHSTVLTGTYTSSGTIEISLAPFNEDANGDNENDWVKLRLKAIMTPNNSGQSPSIDIWSVEYQRREQSG